MLLRCLYAASLRDNPSGWSSGTTVSHSDANSCSTASARCRYARRRPCCRSCCSRTRPRITIVAACHWLERSAAINAAIQRRTSSSLSPTGSRLASTCKEAKCSASTGVEASALGCIAFTTIASGAGRAVSGRAKGSRPRRRRNSANTYWSVLSSPSFGLRQTGSTGSSELLQRLWRRGSGAGSRTFALSNAGAWSTPGGALRRGSGKL